MNEPYCGSAPLPAELATRWNLDPALIATLAALAAFHAVVLWRDAPRQCNGKALQLTGAWLLLIVLFVSPLCALTSALFSARVAHHMIMVGVVAPLLVLALPEAARRLPFSSFAAGSAAIAHAFVLWFWHAPTPYAAALANHGVFWLMEVTLLTSAVWLWLAVLSPRAPLGSALAALLGTTIQTGLLGAAITFARVPLYAPHFGVTDPWGLSALADQQLAGLIMWVPAAVPYLLAAFVMFGQRLARMSASGGRMP